MPAAWSTPTGRAAGLTPGPTAAWARVPATRWRPSWPIPERQVVLLLGDGAFGFSGMEFDTLARHGVAVVGVIGNNGIWGLEKHPMEAIYGYSVAADLRPRTRYDEVAAALGCHGELVQRARRAAPGAGARVRRRRTRARQRAHGSEHRLPAPRRTSPERQTDPTNENRPRSAGGFRSRFGPIGTGRGTCQKGPVRVVRTAGGADVCGFARTYVGNEGRLIGGPHPADRMLRPRENGNRTFVQFLPKTSLGAWSEK